MNKEQKKNKIKDVRKSLIMDTLMVASFGSLSGFGAFWIGVLIGNGLFFSIFVGCMISTCTSGYLITAVFEKALLKIKILEGKDKC